MKSILALILVLACVGVYVWRVENRLAAIGRVEVGDVQTTWTSGGARREVTTHRNAGETLPDWQNRHFAAVKAAQVTFPPDI